MPIIYDKQNQIFNLQTPSTSYIIGLYEGKLPLHLYYGKKIQNSHTLSTYMEGIGQNGWAHTALCADFENPVELSRMPLECPTMGDGDVRPAMFQAKYEDGSIISKLWYTGHKITDGKPSIPGLPATYVDSDDEAQTLELYLEDTYQDIKVVLSYTAYSNMDVITRSMRVINGGKGVVKLTAALSGCIDFQHKDFDFVHFYGSWARERHVERTPLFIGNQSVESLLGSTGHHHNPFVCLAATGADEEQGEVYGANLVYSGNFVSGAFVDPYNRTRLYIGI
ncbi:MAG: alpha-galactosidase, partial [Clostridia bacterium]|nr:alpha-galactosidase [Clostridia bacterium]